MLSNQSQPLKARILSRDIEVATVNAIAAQLDVSPGVAHSLRTLFLLDAAGEALCVEVCGSAHHTPVGDQGEDEDFEEEDDEETAAVKQYTYLNDGVVAAERAGLLKPAGEPFKRSRRSDSLFRYVRLTDEGREIAARFVDFESKMKASKPALAARPLMSEVREAVRAGQLTLRARSRDAHS